MPTSPSSTRASDPRPLSGLAGFLLRGFPDAPAPAVPDRARWRGALVAAGLALAATLALVAAWVAWFDAYRLFRQEPPWLAATQGSNRLLDRQTRRAKIRQAMTRDYGIALVGSSTVYHGLDPDDVDPAWRGAVFNLGISAIRAEELPRVAAVVASRPGVERVTIGLDYYMFSRGDGPAPLSPALATATGRLNTLLGGLWSEDALRDSRLSRVTGATDPGGWTHAGFRVTPPLPPDLTRLNDANRRRTTAAHRPETLAFLRDALDRLAGRQVQAYVAPVSAAQRRVMADLGLLDDFDRWRAAVAEVAAQAGVPLLDLSALGADDPFHPDAGSTEAWLDNLHFTPAIGRLILERLGLRGRPASGVAGVPDPWPGRRPQGCDVQSSVTD